MSSFEPSVDQANGVPLAVLSWIWLPGSPGRDGSTAQIPSLSPYTIQPPTSKKIP